MKHLLAFITFLWVLIFAPALSAQELESIPPGDDKIVPLKKGVPAPFDGQLFNPETALRWANWLEQMKTRLTLDVKKAEDVCKVETAHRDRVLKIEKDRAAAVEKDLHERLHKSEEARLKSEEAARDRPFYDTVEFGIIVGVLASAGVFSLSVWGASELADAK